MIASIVAIVSSDNDICQIFVRITPNGEFVHYESDEVNAQNSPDASAGTTWASFARISLSTAHTRLASIAPPLVRAHVAI